MYLNPNWNILTVGDGDLSFSNALYNHIKPQKLVASTYDAAATLTEKYPDNALENDKSPSPTVSMFQFGFKYILNYMFLLVTGDVSGCGVLISC